MQVNNTVEQVAEVTPNTAIEPQSATQTEQTQCAKQNFDNVETATSYGKFDSAKSLYEGYQQLEREFTKKCQVIKELEEQPYEHGKILDKMIEANPSLKQFEDELKTTSGMSELGVMLAEKLVGKINEPCNIINDEDFLNSYVYSNEKIVNKIVADYLDSLVSLKVPQTIAKGGTTYVSPTYRPRTLDEAGKMAKKFIENRRF